MKKDDGERVVVCTATVKAWGLDRRCRAVKSLSYVFCVYLKHNASSCCSFLSMGNEWTSRRAGTSLKRRSRFLYSKVS